FFEKLTADFERPKELICKQALSEGVTSCTVEIYFEHEGKEYHVIRRFTTQNGVAFKIHEVDKGNYKAIPNESSFMNSILPKDMAEYFFFHGEGISNISSNKSGEKFRRAIRDILGFTFAEKALE